MSVRKILVATIAILAVTLVGQIGFRFMDKPGVVYMASWKDRPSSVQETTDLAEQVVEARVVKIRRAAPLTAKIEGEPGGFDRIPVEVVTLELASDGMKGARKKGERIEMFHTGHSDVPRPSERKDKPRGKAPPKPADGIDESQAPAETGPAHAGAQFSALIDSPAFKVGEKYVLFLRKGPDLTVGNQKTPTMAIVSPEGRFKVDSRGNLTPTSRRPFAQALNGKSVAELKRQIKPGKDK